MTRDTSLRIFRSPKPEARSPTPEFMDIAVLGLFVADIVGRPIDGLPTKGTLGLIERIELHIGGNGANTCSALGKLGVSCAALGKVGADSFGEFMTAAVAKDGVDVRGVVRDPNSTTSATIVAVHSDAERTFLHVAGANATYIPDEVIWDATDGAKIFYVAGLQLMLAMEGENIAFVLKEARRRGMTTVLDTVMNPRSVGWSGLEPAMPHLDWAIPSFEEAAQHTGERTPAAQAARMKAAGAKNVAIKDGAAGCHIFPADAEPFHVPAFPVEAIDALGAGRLLGGGLPDRTSPPMAPRKDGPLRQRGRRVQRPIPRRNLRRFVRWKKPFDFSPKARSGNAN